MVPSGSVSPTSLRRSSGPPGAWRTLARPAAAARAVDDRLHDDVEHPAAVGPRGDRLADAADRGLQPPAFGLELLEAPAQLAGHGVELVAQRGELVVALRRDLRVQLAAAEAAGGLQQPRDLGLQGARHGGREQEREQDEGEQEEDDRAAVVAGLAVALAAVGEQGDGGRPAP